MGRTHPRGPLLARMRWPGYVCWRSRSAVPRGETATIGTRIGGWGSWILFVRVRAFVRAFGAAAAAHRRDTARLGAGPSRITASPRCPPFSFSINPAPQARCPRFPFPLLSSLLPPFSLLVFSPCSLLQLLRSTSTTTSAQLIIYLCVCAAPQRPPPPSAPRPRRRATR